MEEKLSNLKRGFRNFDSKIALRKEKQVKLGMSPTDLTVLLPGSEKLREGG